MERVIWEWYHPLKLLVSSEGELKKLTGVKTFGTLVRNRRWIKSHGVRNCVAQIVLETHRPRGGPYTDLVGGVIWKDGDTSNNCIRNLLWIPKVPLRDRVGNDAIFGPHKQSQPRGGSDQSRQE